MQLAMVLCWFVASVMAHAGKLPEFMDAQQLTAWRAQHAAPTATVAPTPDEQTSFFTGKPYDATSGTYLFLFRSYSPTIDRWTSTDPSGFPDGANNQRYAPSPTTQLDKFGLFYRGSHYSNFATDAQIWIGSKLRALPLTLESLNHADGSTPGNWSLSTADDNAIENSNLYQNKIYTYIQNYLQANSPSYGDLQFPSTVYTFSVFPFLGDPDLYYAFHTLAFSIEGEVSWNDTDTVGTYSAEISLSKGYTFVRHNGGYTGEWPWNAAGYGLQTHGYINPYTISGSFTDEWTWYKE